MATTKITAPAKTPGEVATYFGPHNIVFKDGVAEFEGELPDGLRAYLAMAGYGIGSSSPREPEVLNPADPRKHDNELIGTDLRDAAVDPQPEDFLPPVNAGKKGEAGNPHGFNVVSPGIHAVSGPGPIVPGTVGSKDYQEAKESATAEAVLVRDVPATEVAAALGDLARQEYAKTGDDGLAVEVESLDQGDVDEVIDDGPSPEATLDPAPEPAAQPEPQEQNTDPAAEALQLKGAALDEALEAANLSKSGTADEKRARLAEHRGGAA